MKVETAKIKSKEMNNEAEFQYAYPETLQEAISVDGEERVLNLYRQERKTSYLDYGRALLKAGKTPTEVTEAMNSYKLGDRRPAAQRSPVSIDVEKIKAMSPEERKAQIAKLVDAMAALKAVKG